jgi:cell wall-associated NlpC family hydrolase
MAVVESARRFLGHPWVLGASGCSGEGMDCAGLITAVIEDLGLQGAMPEYKPTRTNKEVLLPHEDPKSMLSLFKLAFKTDIPFNSAGVGDVEVYCLRNTDISCHCAILTDIGIIHTHRGVGKVVETERCRFWNKRRKAVFHLKGIED